MTQDLPVQHLATALAAAGITHLGLAVSGGSDSTALLLAAADLARATNLRLSAVTLDHGLRAEAAAEAAAVAALAARLAVPHQVLHWDGRTSQGNLMDQARAARYRLIAAWAQGAAVQAVALAHSRDDQAETFLMRLSRAAGVDGLAAMQADFTRDGMRWLRPYLGLGRADLRRFLTARGQGWIDDPTNADPAYGRTRARAALAALAPLGIGAETLADVAVHLGAVRVALDRQRADLAQVALHMEDGDLILDPAPFVAAPPEAQRRLLVAMLGYLGQGGYPPRAAPVASLLAAIATQGRGRTLSGVRATPEKGRWRFGREPAAIAALQCPADAVWDGRWRAFGPDRAAHSIRALGELGLAQLPQWRQSGRKRANVITLPSIWRDQNLVSAPFAGFDEGWRLELATDFASWLDSH